MKPKHQRLLFILIGLSFLGISAAIITYQFRENIVFFYSPTDVTTTAIPQKTIRIGGLVKEGSIKQLSENEIEFEITDTNASVTIRYNKIKPPMFREGQGTIATGTFNSNNIFIADTLLTKHDETYMPPEVSDALKKSGNWHEGK